MRKKGKYIVLDSPEIISLHTAQLLAMGGYCDSNEISSIIALAILEADRKNKKISLVRFFIDPFTGDWRYFFRRKKHRK